MASREMAFGDIPGLDPGEVTDASLLPSRPFVIAARVIAGGGVGAILVDTGDIYHAEVGSSSLILRLDNAQYTDVICETPGYSVAGRDPSNRTGITYAGFGLGAANTFQLSNGGRLLADARRYGSGATTSLLPAASLEGYPERGQAKIERILADVEEARLALEGIGAYMGLEDEDGRLLARIALDFDRTHEGGRPALG